MITVSFVCVRADEFDSPTVGLIDGESTQDRIFLSTLTKGESILFRLLFKEPDTNATEVCTSLRDARVLAFQRLPESPNILQSYKAEYWRIKEGVVEVVKALNTKLTSQLEALEVEIHNTCNRAPLKNTRKRLKTVQKSVLCHVFEKDKSKEPSCKLFRQIGARIELCRALSQVWRFDNVVYVRSFFDAVDQLSEVDQEKYRRQTATEALQRLASDVDFATQSLHRRLKYWDAEVVRWKNTCNRGREIISFVWIRRPNKR